MFFLIAIFVHSLAPSTFSCVPPGVDPGETQEQAAHRELLEEAGASGRLDQPSLGDYVDREKRTKTTAYGLEVDMSAGLQRLEVWEEAAVRGQNLSSFTSRSRPPRLLLPSLPPPFHF